MAAAAIVHPQRSEIGHPLEAIITCAALLMGLIIRWTIVDASWRSFKEDLQAQEETRAAKEQQLAAEKENVQFQLTPQRQIATSTRSSNICSRDSWAVHAPSPS